MAVVGLRISVLPSYGFSASWTVVFLVSANFQMVVDFFRRNIVAFAVGTPVVSELTVENMLIIRLDSLLALKVNHL